MRTLIPVLVPLALFGCTRGGDGTVEPVDLDGDGSFSEADCNDSDPLAFPGNPESCDGVDNDCNGIIDNDPTDAATFFADVDGDSYGDPSVTLRDCDQPAGYVADASDCNDNSTDYHPGAVETDCTDPNDYNCDGSVGYEDVDADGFAACQDCDDTLGAVNPDAAEVCNSIDDDCDGVVDGAAALDADTWFADGDDDGFGDPREAVDACTAPEGYVANDSDCNDTAAAAFPGGIEVCDDLDNDCNGDVDDGAGDATSWFADGDNDGFGGAGAEIVACDGPVGFVTDGTDCNDSDAGAYPGASESCDFVDNDCDGAADNGFDTDGDGVTTCGGDCDDGDGAVNPGASESCDGIDNDCDGAVDEDGATASDQWYLDYDGDGYGDDGLGVQSCSAPSPIYVDRAGDCDDTDDSFSPGASPGCDGLDYDCDGAVDSDVDGDGYADSVCGGTDCDDSDPSVFPDIGGSCPLGTSCLDLLSRGVATSTGIYNIDSDGIGLGQPAFDAYCDMDTDGGGWTLVLRVSRLDSGIDFNTDASGWQSTGYNSVTDISLSDSDDPIDHVSPAYNTLGADDLMFRHRLGTDYQYSLRTDDSFMSGASLRTYLAQPWVDGGRACSSSVIYMGGTPDPYGYGFLVLAGDEAGDTEPTRIGTRCGCSCDNEYLAIGGFGSGHGTVEISSQGGVWGTMQSGYVFVR